MGKNEKEKLWVKEAEERIKHFEKTAIGKTEVCFADASSSVEEIEKELKNKLKQGEK